MTQNDRTAATAEERVARHLAAKDHPRTGWDAFTDRCRDVYMADARKVVAIMREPAAVAPPADRAGVAAVRALHQQYAFGDDPQDYCAHCNQITGSWIPWPCPTILALDAAVLPAPDQQAAEIRAAALLEAADRLSRKASALTEGLHDLALFVAKARIAEAETLDREAAELRRLAGETQQDEPSAADVQHMLTRMRAITAQHSLDELLRLIAVWAVSSEGRDVLLDDLTAAGYRLPHSCGNCDGIDSGSCLFNPDRRPREARQDPAPGDCTCDHEADEHSVYGCQDDCACEWMPKRATPAKPAPMSPLHILGIGTAPDHCTGQIGYCAEHGVHRPATLRSGDATVDPAMCPRCKGDNSQAFELCNQCAAPARSGQPDTNQETVCVCGHGRAYHDAKYADPQCRLCPEDGERSWRHPFTPTP